MTIFKVNMPFDHVLQAMKRTNRKAIRSPETLENGRYKVFLADVTLTIKRYAAMDRYGECMRVEKIDKPEESTGNRLMEMRAKLIETLKEKTKLDWSGHYKVSLQKYQFLCKCGEFIAKTPEYDVHKVFSDPPMLEQLADVIVGLYQKKSQEI